MGRQGVAELFLAAPLSSARITPRRHPERSAPLPPYRQHLATPQPLLSAVLAFETAFNDYVRHSQ